MASPSTIGVQSARVGKQKTSALPYAFNSSRLPGVAFRMTSTPSGVENSALETTTSFALEPASTSLALLTLDYLWLAFMASRHIGFVALHLV